MEYGREKNVFIPRYGEERNLRFFDKNVLILMFPEERAFRLQEKKNFKTMLSVIIHKMVEENLSFTKKSHLDSIELKGNNRCTLPMLHSFVH